jgi:hypothetical protein
MEGVKPKVRPLKSRLDEYDAIFLGYPVWFGTFALPIAGLLEAETLADRDVVPFCTFGSGGLESSIRDLQTTAPRARIHAGYGVRSARLGAMPEELTRFLTEQGYLEGEVAPLPAYDEAQPVTDEEKAIFNAACGDYQFPLGTPVTAGKRDTERSVDYEFTARGKDQSGVDTTFTIYVTVPKAENAKPEFTRVVR